MLPTYRAVATIGAGGAKAPHQSVWPNCPPPTFGKLKYVGGVVTLALLMQ